MNPVEQPQQLNPGIVDQISGFEDVPLPVNIELDRRILTLRQVLSLDVGSTLRMSRSAGENLDLQIGGAVVGFGEIVISETTTGFRITDFNTKE
jgi:flagellar motor switch protein FliN/FliY